MIRARFAPSPTGYLHVGSARTALFNWLFCRSVGGRLVLRIEDTDQARNQSELVDNILEVLTWLGIDWDEGPFFQSARADRHREAVDQLVAAGAAYVDEGAVRFRVPDDGVTGWDDVVRGRVEFENANLEDFVIQRSDGSAMFLLANVVDDADMGVTHVVRGEDMVNNTPKQLLLRRAMGGLPEAGEAVDLRPPAAAGRRPAPQAVQALRRRVGGELPGARASWPRRWPTTWRCWAGDRPTGSRSARWPRSSSGSGWRTSTRPGAFFDVKKLTHINGTYLRQLSRRGVRQGGGAVGLRPRRRARRRCRTRSRSGRTRWGRCRA